MCEETKVKINVIAESTALSRRKTCPPISEEGKTIAKLIGECTPLPVDLITDLIIAYSQMYPGRHKFVVHSVEFDVDRKYFPVKFCCSENPFSISCLVENRDKKEAMAIQKSPRIVRDLPNAKRIYREMKLLRHLDHPNVIKLCDLIQPRSLDYIIQDVYMVVEAMESDLDKIIYSRQKLSNEHIQFFMFQILKGLRYLHSVGLVHRDLKPSNLLVNRNCEVKICNFLSFRGIDEPLSKQSEEDAVAEYKFIKQYQAPELFLGSATKYDTPNDIWAIGCTFAELLGRKVLFPGQDILQQVQLIIDKVGQPSREDLEFVSSTSGRSFIERLSDRKKVCWSQLFPQASPLACDLLEQMLQFNPKKRITAEQALKHEYFKSLLSKESRRMTKEVAQVDWKKKLEFVDDDPASLQDLLWEEIYHFRPYLKSNREAHLMKLQSRNNFSRKQLLNHLVRKETSYLCLP